MEQQPTKRRRWDTPAPNHQQTSPGAPPTAVPPAPYFVNGQVHQQLVAPADAAPAAPGMAPQPAAPRPAEEAIRLAQARAAALVSSFGKVRQSKINNCTLLLRRMRALSQASLASQFSVTCFHTTAGCRPQGRGRGCPAARHPPRGHHQRRATARPLRADSAQQPRGYPGAHAHEPHGAGPLQGGGRSRRRPGEAAAPAGQARRRLRRE